MLARIARSNPVTAWKAATLTPARIATMAVDLAWHKGEARDPQSGAMTYDQNGMTIVTSYDAVRDQQHVAISEGTKLVYRSAGSPSKANRLECPTNEMGLWRLQFVEAHQQLKREQAQLHRSIRKQNPITAAR